MYLLLFCFTYQYWKQCYFGRFRSTDILCKLCRLMGGKVFTIIHMKNQLFLMCLLHTRVLMRNLVLSDMKGPDSYAEVKNDVKKVNMVNYTVIDDTPTRVIR
jgi:hypothetical protein